MTIKYNHRDNQGTIKDFEVVYEYVQISTVNKSKWRYHRETTISDWKSI